MNTSEKHCATCRVVKPLSQFWREIRQKDGHRGNCIDCARAVNLKAYRLNPAKHIASTEKWRDKNKARFLQSNRDRTLRRRLQVVNAYGGKCTCCGEETFEFLTLEHVNGDGREHRQRSHNTDGTYRDVINANFPSEYTILCMNCNWASRGERICPHQQTEK